MGGAAAESGCVGLGLGQVEREGTHSVLCRTVRSPGQEPVCDGRAEAQADWSMNFWPQHTAGGRGACFLLSGNPAGVFLRAPPMVECHSLHKGHTVNC